MDNNILALEESRMLDKCVLYCGLGMIEHENEGVA